MCTYVFVSWYIYFCMLTNYVFLNKKTTLLPALNSKPEIFTAIPSIIILKWMVFWIFLYLWDSHIYIQRYVSISISNMPHLFLMFWYDTFRSFMLHNLFFTCYIHVFEISKVEMGVIIDMVWYLKLKENTDW